MRRLLEILRSKVGIMLNGHDERSRCAWMILVENIEEEAAREPDRQDTLGL